MPHKRCFQVGVVALLNLVSSVALAEPPQELAERINRELHLVWQDAGVTCSDRSDDAEFLRRVTLDIIGRIPTVQEVRTFLADEADDKRERCIDRLLASPGFSRHWANVLRHELLPQADTPQFDNLALPFEKWLQGELQNGTDYQTLVHKLLTVDLNRENSSAAVNFFAAGELRPANLAASSARVFLGINLDCAQCHDHPFAQWSRQDFWQFAAFFSRTPECNTAQPFTILVPDTEEVVAAQWLTQEPIAWPASVNEETGRQLLASWITSDENPFFTRNAINRVWAQLMGNGLVETLDNLSDENQPSVLTIMDMLTSGFAAARYDLKYLIATVTRLEAYQLTTEYDAGKSQDGEPRLFHHMPVRGLSGEQLYASLLTAAGQTDKDEQGTPYLTMTNRQRFVAKFTSERPSRSQRSVLQTLELMNSSFTDELLTGKTLLAIAETPFLDPKEKLTTLFLATLGRPPLPAEAADFEKALPTLRNGDPEALKAVFWVLMNSAEFSVNH